MLRAFLELPYIRRRERISCLNQDRAAVPGFVHVYAHLALGFGQTRQASCGTVGYYPSECFHQETAAEPSTDVFSVGVMLAIIVQQPNKRDSNVFASKV